MVDLTVVGLVRTDVHGQHLVAYQLFVEAHDGRVGAVCVDKGLQLHLGSITDSLLCVALFLSEPQKLSERFAMLGQPLFK